MYIYYMSSRYGYASMDIYVSISIVVTVDTQSRFCHKYIYTTCIYYIMMSFSIYMTRMEKKQIISLNVIYIPYEYFCVITINNQ